MKKKCITILSLALAMVACQEKSLDKGFLDTGKEMLFNVQIPSVQTKVMADVFEESDVIGLYVTDYLDDNNNVKAIIDFGFGFFLLCSYCFR